MFYYVTDYYDTSTTSTNPDYATLVYYNNVEDGEPSNSKLSAYGSNNWHGPVTAVTHLPPASTWNNVSLYKTTRAILGKGNVTASTGGDFQTAFSYSEYSSRLLTDRELDNACNKTTSNLSTGSLDNCTFLLENTDYASSGYVRGVWLETPYANMSNWVYLYDATNRSEVSTSVTASNYGIRPVIEIPKSEITY